MCITVGFLFLFLPLFILQSRSTSQSARNGNPQEILIAETGTMCVERKPIKPFFNFHRNHLSLNSLAEPFPEY